MLIPISIAYDQIQDLGSYASEAAGSAKEKESLSWVLSAIRSLGRRYGNIHVRFGEPLSVAKAMATNPRLAGTKDEDDVELAKLAFEVMYRIGQVTPITPAAVVSIALLQAGGAARTIDQLSNACAALEAFIEQQHLPTTETLRLENPGEVQRVIDLLSEHGNVVTFESDTPVFFLKPDQALRAAYYRNVVVHHFVPRGVLELALAMLDPNDHQKVGAVGKVEEQLWDEVDKIRDLLKFEFFFPEKQALRASIRDDLDRAVPGWTRFTAGTILGRLTPRIAPWAIVPFLESYLIVADALGPTEPGPTKSVIGFNEKDFIVRAMKLGEAYRLMGKVAADSVSAVLFRHALALARNRGLVEDGPEAQAARIEFSNAIGRVIEAGRRITHP